MEEKKSALDRLAKKLNSRNGQKENLNIRRSSLGGARERTGPMWEKPTPSKKKRKRFNFSELLFVGSVVFFLIAGVFASFLFFSGNNTVSTRNVTIALDGPTSIRAGETIPLQIIITNKNSVPMELVDLVVEFPEGTRSETDISIRLPRIRESLGTINPAESVNRTIRAVVFGQASTDVSIGVSVEYRVTSSNAIFVSESEYTLPISQSPASITVESLQEIVSGQETAITVTVSSNIPDTLNDILLVAEYPPGFSFNSANPSPVTGSNTWRLGDIEQGGERTVTIQGTFSGEDNDERVVHFTAGSESEKTKDEISAPLATSDVAFKLAKPFISLVLSLDGEIATEKTVTRGEQIRGDIRWVNNLPTRAQDVEIEIKLDGVILDRNTVVAQTGFWRSFDNTLIWSRETDSSLIDVAPGASGLYSFTLSTLPKQEGVFKNPEITLTATVRARRVTEDRVPEIIESSTTSRLLVATDLALKSTLQYISGPQPPKADSETIYRVSWTVTNSANAVANASVAAALPSYVRFTPESAASNISYNNIGGVVTWDIGDLTAGESRTTTFQVGVTPSLSQVGQLPTVVSDQRVYGFDRFTRSQIERALSSLTTQSAAPTSKEGIVVP